MDYRLCRLVLLVTAITMPTVAAAEISVTDTKGATTKLLNISTSTIQFDSGATRIQMPLKVINRLELGGDGKSLVVTTTSGKELTGKSRSSLEGEWDLGKYSITLDKIRLVDFGRGDASKDDANSTDDAKQEKDQNEFTVRAVDRTGLELQIKKFAFNFRYSYPTPGWIGKYSTSSVNRRLYIPFRHHGIVVGVPFADVKEFVADDTLPKSVYGWEPPVTVVLTDGRELNGKIARLGSSGHAFVGATEFGTIELDIAKVKKVQFEHTQSKDAERVSIQTPRSKKHETPYSISVTTWEGQKSTLHNACAFQLDDGYRWDQVSATLKMSIGEATHTVGFDKIKAIKFNKKGKLGARLTAESGKEFTVTITGYTTCLGGDAEEFGKGWINLSRVAAVELRRTAARDSQD